MTPPKLSPEEFLSWLAPRRALADLERQGLSSDEARTRLVEHAIKGGVRVRAYESTSLAAIGGGTIEFPKVPRGAWSTSDAIPSEFWDSGAIEFPSNGSPIFDAPVSYTGVRFDPTGVALLVERIRDQIAAHANAMGSIVRASAAQAGLAIQPNERVEMDFLARTAPITDHLGPSAPALLTGSPPLFDAPRRRANPMTGAEIDAWHSSLSEDQRSLSVNALWTLAKAHHPGRHIARKQIEPFGRGRSQGHRPTR